MKSLQNIWFDNKGNAFSTDDDIGTLSARGGDDVVELGGSVERVMLGRGDDHLSLSDTSGEVRGGGGIDTLELDRGLASFDITFEGEDVVLDDWLTGGTLRVRGVEHFDFDGSLYAADQLQALLELPGGEPAIHVSEGTSAVAVNDPDPSEVVLWNRAALMAVIEIGTVGPTPASRAYAELNTAIYDAWATFSDTAVRVSLDAGGDNALLAQLAEGLDGADVGKAISYAAHQVLTDLFPSQGAIFDTLLTEKLGLALGGDGSVAAAIGLDAAADLIALRHDDGANQLGGYADTTGYQPVNPHPGEINDITRWTPENIPLDPEDAMPEQRFLTPQWPEVESFSLPEDADGKTVFDGIRPDAPVPFFGAGYEGSVLDFDAGTITLSAAVELDGTLHAAGDEIAVSKELIGTVINPGFIAQAETLIGLSANLSERDKLQAEFYEDGGGTAFPPGTWISFANWLSADRALTLDEDVQLFFMVGNAVMDAGIATWESKVHYDYARPVRGIRDLGELGLIGEPGVDELTGETGHVIEAWGGIDAATGEDLGTRTILAENFTPYQRWLGHPSPPFAEHVSGHSTYSSAAATAMRLFTGSDDFGAQVVFPPGSAQFVPDLPSDTIVFEWETFSDAAQAAGDSRLYGGIHWPAANEGGLALGEVIGSGVHEMALRFINGEATDSDRPFWTDDLI